MSSNKFLQRFEGKIQVVGKEGVNPVFGNKQADALVYTNNNFNPNANLKNRTSTSLNKAKPTPQEQLAEKRKSLKKITDNKGPIIKKEAKRGVPLPPPKEKKAENPFLISNPFYLDEDEKVQMQVQRKEREVREKELEKEIKLEVQDPKKTTTYSQHRSLEKKKNDKEWTKMGGLGANIGGDEWLEKKKRQQKIQEFSSQVKHINKDRPNVPKPDRKDDKKELTMRQKAQEYSKNVPKPVVRSVIEKVEESYTGDQEDENELSELQKYELRHQQLKNMLRNDL